MSKLSCAILGTALLVSGTLLAGCQNHQTKASTAHQVLHTTVTASPVTLDPTKMGDIPSESMRAQVYQGLYTFDKNNRLIPGVATKITAPTNHGKTYTFNLRRNAKWSNGDPVVAADFVHAFQHWADPKTKSQSTDKIADFVNFNAVNSGKKPVSSLGVKALGKYRFQIQLTKQVPYLKYMLAASFMPVNSRLLQKYGQKYGTNATKTAYNGAYRVTGWTGVNDTWRYVKNTHFWNQKSVKISQIAVQVAKDDNTSQNLFKSNNIQETSISGNYARENKQNKLLHTNLAATMYYLYFNGKKPLTKNANFHRAMSYVINRQTIAKNVLGDGSIAATGMVPKGDMTNPKTGQDFAAESGQLLPTDLTKAKQYWAAAKADLKQSSYTVNLLADNTDDQKQLAQYIQEVAQKNFKGLKINIKTAPHAQHISENAASNFDITVDDWNSEWPDAADFLDLIQGGNKDNYSNYADATFDQLMTKAATQTNTADRYQTLLKANQRLGKTADVVPLYQAASSHLVASDLSGIKYSLFTPVPRYQYAYWK